MLFSLPNGRMAPRRFRVRWVAIQDSQTACLILELAQRLDALEKRLSELALEQHHSKTAVQKLCAAAELPERVLD